MSLMRYTTDSDAIPIFDNLYGIEEFLNYPIESFLLIAATPDVYYKSFYVNKMNGGKRKIHEPNDQLKVIQQKIHKLILSRVALHPAAKAYYEKASVVENARFHIAQRVLLKMDISDFFNSLQEKQVYKVFSDIGYNFQIAKIFARMCCLNNTLPQGAPTSPVLSNIIMHRTDRIIFRFCNSQKIRYTDMLMIFSFLGILFLVI